MNKLKIYKNPDFGQVRAIEQDGEPWLVGKDVATALGYSNPRKALADHVDEEDKLQGNGVTIRDSIGREQAATLINESGLYSLILSSKLPTARQFKRWVTSEILPSIRRSGSYSSRCEGVALLDDDMAAEIERLSNSPEVKLARKENRLKYKQRQKLYQLRALEKRGRELAAQGVTPENMARILFGEE